MKTRNKFISILCVGILLLLSISMKTSVAAPPTWIGVEDGDEYSWSVTAHFDAYIALMEDLEGVPYTGPSQPDQTIKLKMDVVDVSDELYNAMFDFYWVNVTVIMTQSYAGYEEPSPPLGVVVPRSDTDNYVGTAFAYFNETMSASGDFTVLPLLIVAPGLNWSQIAEELAFEFPEIPEMPDLDYTITARTSGLAFSLEGIVMDSVEIDTMSGYIDYDNDGVVKSAVLRYGGAKLISLGPSSEEAISGYEISITLGVFAVCSVGLIIYFKKKK
jgi:hypothetical protein